MARKSLLVISVWIAGSLVACGGSPSRRPMSSGATRIVDVGMRDIAYEPATIRVKAGETVTFVFHNTGTVVHDAFLGDAAAQAEHEREMSDGMAAMGGMHADDPSATTVQPRQTATLTHTFTTTGSTIIGCHQPGHYQAGMKLTVVVG
jgi:uncharacterized cupredoxin-like copper-binding protein